MNNYPKGRQELHMTLFAEVFVAAHHIHMLTCVEDIQSIHICKETRHAARSQSHRPCGLPVQDYINENVDIYSFGNTCHTPTISTTDPALSKPFALINLGVNPNFLAYTSTI